MSSNANDKFNAAGDRPLGAAKPVDPATRLSELLAQSLEELTRPFDPPRVDPLTRVQPATPSRPANELAASVATPEEADVPSTTASRLDDRALAELEAELFAAASRAPSVAPAEVAEAAIEPHEQHEDHVDEPPAEDHPDEHPAPALDLDRAPPVDLDRLSADLEVAPTPIVPASIPPAGMDDDAAARLVSKVRRLMLISMLVTFIAVGSVFGFIGYRVFKGDGSTAKIADKLPEAPAGATAEMMLALPRGARVVQSAVAEDRLIVTLDVGGKIEVRTFDLKTLQPAGRLTFSTTP